MRSDANKTVQHTPVTSTNCDDDIPEIGREDSGAVGSKARIVCKEDVIALKDLFAEEIKATLVTMTVVKDKIQGNPKLRFLDSRKVYDKILSEWRFSDNTMQPQNVRDG